MKITDLKVSSIDSSELFVDIYNNPEVKTIPFLDEWMGATEYLNGVTTVANLEYGEIRKFVDSYNRKCILVSTGNAAICIFERYTGNSNILVSNFPDKLQAVKSASKMHSPLEKHSLFIMLVTLQQMVTKERSPILAYSILHDTIMYKTQANGEYYVPFDMDEVHLPVRGGLVIVGCEHGLRPYIKSNTTTLLPGVKYLDFAQLSTLVEAFNNTTYAMNNNHRVNLNTY